MRSAVGLAIAMVLVLAGSSQAEESIDFGEYHALLIGNEDYTGWPRLATPDADVEALAELLEDRYGFTVQVLKNATRDQIIDELEALKRELDARDNLLIYYAGHGILRSDGGYWIGVDASQGSSSRWLHYATVAGLVDAAGGIAARHVLVVADSCYAGALLREGVDEATRRPNESRRAWLQRMARTPSRTALTSGGTEPVVDRAGGARHSVFAEELLGALRANDQPLEALALFERVAEDVHARARRVLGNAAQAPEYGRIPGTGHRGGDFVFVPKGSEVPAPDDVDDGPETEFGIRGPEVLAGRVAWAGETVPGATVVLYDADDQARSHPLAETRTDSSGAFELQARFDPDDMICAYPPSPPFHERFCSPARYFEAGTGLLTVAKRLKLLEPKADETVSTRTPVLRWEAHPRARSYVVTLFDETTKERVLYEQTHAATLALRAPLQRGRQFQWSVRAFASDPIRPDTSLAYDHGWFWVR